MNKSNLNKNKQIKINTVKMLIQKKLTTNNNIKIKPNK